MKPPIYRTCAAILILTGVAISHAASAREVQLEHGGLTLNAELELAEGKSLADGLILMTHGTLAHGRMEIMRGLQNVFKEYGFNTLAINLSLGQSNRTGMYDCAARHTHKHTDAMDEIGVWLDWAKGEGADNVVLLGHSRGGNQTAWFAAEHSDPAVAAVVLVAPALWDAQYEREQYKSRYGADLDALLNEAKGLVEQGKGDTVMEKVDFVYCEDTEVTAETFVSYYEDDPRKNTPDLLAKIDKPVLVFAGSEDTVVKGLEEEVEPLADGKKVKLVVIEGAEHMFRDLYLYDIVEGAQEFLEAQ